MSSNSVVDYYLAGQLDSAMIRYTSAIPMYEAIGSQEKLAKTYNNIGLIYNKLGLVEEAQLLQ